MGKQQFTVILLPDEDGYQVVFPHYPDCITSGATVDEALKNAREAVELHMEGLAELGADPVAPNVRVDHVVVGEIEADIPDVLLNRKPSVGQSA
ncbi:MAG: hypothetical protein BZY87_04395 [SAR202 cluster bacterium Io17-Chloro-G6]|nr:MAG: hypothetical protein BZY87_04395 [SAR202 cluster bacterium Io17-Chloro-G6]